MTAAKAPVLKISSKRIDEYANSMFRFEHLHDSWIGRCAGYLKKVFGRRLAGATVIDYAFGRGNWAVAFARAGARSVIAIDASKTNVSRFKKYCRLNHLKQIKVLHGNILERPMELSADIVWAYGILPCIPEADRFVHELSRLITPDGEMLVYAYDKGSLREVIVGTTRMVLTCSNEARFRELSYMLSPAARLRACDDLTAPYIRWYSEEQLVALLKRHRLFPSRRVESFQEFLGHHQKASEFSPHHIIVSKSGNRQPMRSTTSSPLATDILILRQMIHQLFSGDHCSVRTKRAMAVGLLNTHFSALEKAGGAMRAAYEDFLFLLYAAMSHEVDVMRLPKPAQEACRMALAKGSLRTNWRSGDADCSWYGTA